MFEAAGLWVYGLRNLTRVRPRRRDPGSPGRVLGCLWTMATRALGLLELQGLPAATMRFITKTVTITFTTFVFNVSMMMIIITASSSSSYYFCLGFNQEGPHPSSPTWNSLSKAWHQAFEAQALYDVVHNIDEASGDVYGTTRRCSFFHQTPLHTSWSVSRRGWRPSKTRFCAEFGVLLGYTTHLIASCGGIPEVQASLATPLCHNTFVPNSAGCHGLNFLTRSARNARIGGFTLASLRARASPDDSRTNRVSQPTSEAPESYADRSYLARRLSRTSQPPQFRTPHGLTQRILYAIPHIASERKASTYAIPHIASERKAST